MKLISLSESIFKSKFMRTSEREFMDDTNPVMPWDELVSLIVLYAPMSADKGTRLPVAALTLLLTHFFQRWFSLLCMAMDVVPNHIELIRNCGSFVTDEDSLFDECAIVRFLSLIKKHKLCRQTTVVILNAKLAARGMFLEKGIEINVPSTSTSAWKLTNINSEQGVLETRHSIKRTVWYIVYISSVVHHGVVRTLNSILALDKGLVQLMSIVRKDENSVFGDRVFYRVGKRKNSIF